MADQQITDLPVATEANDADLLLMRQGSTDKSVTKEILFDNTLKADENLDDIPNKATARTNLDVPQTNTVLLKANNLSDLPNAATARDNLGVEIGADVQAYSAQLAAVAANNTATGFVAQTGTNTVASRTLGAPAAGLTISNPTGAGGNPAFALANDLAALEALASTGFAARTGSDAWAQRSLTQPAAGLTITNPAGIAGDPTFALANDLAALEALSSTGIAVRTGSDTWAQRTVTGTANQVDVTNGNGVSGNPTLTLPAQIILPSDTSEGSISMREQSASGTNKFTLEAPGTITNDFKWKVVESDLPTAKSLLKIDTSGNLRYSEAQEVYLGNLDHSPSGWASTSIFNSAYDYYKLRVKITEVYCSTNNKKILLQLYADGAYRTSGYLCSGTGLDANGTTYSVNSTSAAGFIICNNNASNPSRIEMMELTLTKDGSLFGNILLNNTGYYAPVIFGGFSGGGSITTLQGARIILDDSTTTNLTGAVLVYGCNDITL